MRKCSLPSVTFGIIVLNGEPFTLYNLRGIYPFAHQIIVVEGATPAASAVATSDGHSTDGTLESLIRFKEEEDSENKVTIVTAEDEGHPNGFWPGEKDEMCRSYAKRATGDYLWHVDIDEFYKPEDIYRILKILANSPSVTGVSFFWKNFWGSFDSLVDGWEYRELVKRIKGIRRVYKWGEGYTYVSHRPPTVLDATGQDLFSTKFITAEKTKQLGIFCYHYGMIFIEQAKLKASYYKKMWASHKDMVNWYQYSFLNLDTPFRILHGTNPPSWLKKFDGTHPPQIKTLMKHMRECLITTKPRPTEDINKLLSSIWYRTAVIVLENTYPIYALLNFVKARVFCFFQRWITLN